jgi:hypothetical protein
MPIPSYRIAPGANRGIIPPVSLGAALRQTSFAARKVESREHASMPHRHATAPTPNPKSTFSRIIPMNPEPAATLAPDPRSAFSRTNPPVSRTGRRTPTKTRNCVFPNLPFEPRADRATRGNRKSAFSRIYPMNPEPAATPAPDPRSEFSRTNPPAFRSRRGTRTKPRIDVFVYQPSDPGAGRGSHAKSPIHVSAYQPCLAATAGGVRHDAHDGAIPADLRLHSIALAQSRKTLARCARIADAGRQLAAPISPGQPGSRQQQEGSP